MFCGYRHGSIVADMATRQETNAFTPSTEELALIINNGDLASLRETMNRLGFKDEASMIRFALAVLAQSAIRSVKITDTDGKELTLNPSASLLRTVEQEQ